jgi:DUF3072 family protein
VFGAERGGYPSDMNASNTHSTDDRRPEGAAAEGAEEQPLGAGAPPAGSSTEKDPEAWVTGDEPMTGAQRSYLDTLARQAGETLSPNLTKAEASEHIDRLQDETGRGS